MIINFILIRMEFTANILPKWETVLVCQEPLTIYLCFFTLTLRQVCQFIKSNCKIYNNLHSYRKFINHPVACAQCKR